MLIDVALVPCVDQHFCDGMATNRLACFIKAAGRGGVVLPAEKQGWRPNGAELRKQIEIVESTAGGEFIGSPHGFVERCVAA